MPVERLGENFLTPEDVDDGDVLTITQKPELVETQWKNRDGTPKRRYRIAVKLEDGKEKPTTLNNTSSNALLDVFGPDENAWLGREIIVEKTLSKVRGEDKFVLYFKPKDRTPHDSSSKKEAEAAVGALTLAQAQELTKDWSPQLAADFVNHLHASGRLIEGP